MRDFAKKINFSGIGEILIPGCVTASLLVMFFNVPGPLMDWLLSFNITLSVVVLLTTFFVRRPIDFNIFPTLLLATTLFRLTLNIGTTRLILTRAGEYKTAAAGQVVEAFSRFVSADSLVVGGVIFAIFVVIQFVVITKGANRISEVAARFTLDALPGRQTAIDADLAAGIIDADEARRRRDELTDTSDFFGAMDGAGKFVRGDAIAGLIIILVNCVGGILIGTLQQGRPLLETLATYTTLTVGDGLVSQVPALLISLATGILVSRGSRSTDLSSTLTSQLLFHPAVFGLGGAFLLLMAFTGLPVLPISVLAAGCFLLAWSLARKNRTRKAEAQALQKRLAERQTQRQKSPSAEGVERYLRVDPLELQIGVGLVRIVQEDASGETMTERIGRVRNELAGRLGLILPKVRIRDRLELDENRYRILIAGQTVAEGVIWPDRLLAIDTAQSAARLNGIKTVDALSGRNAFWIDEREREKGEIFGFQIVGAAEALARMFQAVVIREAAEILTLDAMGGLIDELKKAAPAVVDELIPGTLKPQTVLRTLKRLLREQVSIRPLGTIFETLGDAACRTTNPIPLAESVRIRLGRLITDKYRDADGKLRVVQIDPWWEEAIRDQTEMTDDEIRVVWDPADAEEWDRLLDSALAEAAESREPVSLLVSPAIRPAVRELTAARFPNLAVLGYGEIPRSVEIVPEGIVRRQRVAA